MALLEVSNLSKTYHSHDGSYKVLEQVSFSLDEGACLGLVGASGSGKSTLARLILAFEQPDSGQILFAGHEWTRMKEKDRRPLRRELQFVMQNGLQALNPRKLVGESIAEPLKNYETLSSKQRMEKGVSLLEDVGLTPEDAWKYPHQFSGGQLQRINIARALALYPKMIVLDEAVSNLDLVRQVQIIQLLKKLQKEYQLAYLFITHDVHLLDNFADTTYELAEGKLHKQS